MDPSSCRQIYARYQDRVIKLQLCRQESHLEMGYLTQCDVDKDDLNPSVRNLSALCSLYRSVVCGPGYLLCPPFSYLSPQTWFTQELNALKSSPEGALSPTSAPPHLDSMSVFSSQISPSSAFLDHTSKDNQLSLPLSHEMTL